jgi:hypothetical protein
VHARVPLRSDSTWLFCDGNGALLSPKKDIKAHLKGQLKQIVLVQKAERKRTMTKKGEKEKKRKTRLATNRYRNAFENSCWNPLPSDLTYPFLRGVLLSATTDTNAGGSHLWKDPHKLRNICFFALYGN